MIQNNIAPEIRIGEMELNSNILDGKGIVSISSPSICSVLEVLLRKRLKPKVMPSKNPPLTTNMKTPKNSSRLEITNEVFIKDSNVRFL
jgi:hypothetical protein